MERKGRNPITTPDLPVCAGRSISALLRYLTLVTHEAPRFLAGVTAPVTRYTIVERGVTPINTLCI